MKLKNTYNIHDVVIGYKPFELWFNRIRTRGYMFESLTYQTIMLEMFLKGFEWVLNLDLWMFITLGNVVKTCCYKLGEVLEWFVEVMVEFGWMGLRPNP